MTCWSSKCFYNLFFNLLRTLFRFVLVYPFAHLRNMKGTLCAQIKGEYHWVCHVLGFGGKLAGNGFLPFSSKRWFCICLTDSDCIINMQMLNFNRILLTHIVSNLQIMFYIYICTDFFVLHVGCNKKKLYISSIWNHKANHTKSWLVLECMKRNHFKGSSAARLRNRAVISYMYPRFPSPAYQSSLCINWDLRAHYNL